ncbi:hypothetical protein CYLTODRAFT_490825 [Cylindrobasidium torrendii FP15055 ss-10]|uniref:PB1 domain-containing protein n=1 Tax=Cylindrobasidium torrendii FP15055 ss-10 TaxID=1314674 RepID=A0A0D7BAF6_9AGAR|nr:hypothetical protein CYLTODRAFT_490825 [Cylindrobasidium torrendii FP15055 ss-10]
MSTITFKLKSSLGGETRRVSFNVPPSWNILASRIRELYGIPAENLGVTYTDADGDQITLSSDEELREFYRSSFSPGDVVRFNVQDLRQTRTESLRSSFADTASNPSRRNTFGKDPILQFHIDEDWQSVPTFNNVYQPAAPPSEHGYLETITSVSDEAERDNEDEQPFEEAKEELAPASPARRASSKAPSSRDSSIYGAPIPRVNKGKGRALYSPSLSSDHHTDFEDELLATPKQAMSDFSAFPQYEKELPNLYSVHSSTPHMESPHLKRTQGSLIPVVDKHGSKSPSSTSSSPSPSQPSTPSPRVPRAPRVPRTPTNISLESEGDFSDPPLAQLDDKGPAPPQDPSIANDIAFLLDSVRTVFQSHPELSDSFAHIIKNTSNGQYWQQQRETIARAASEYAAATAASATSAAIGGQGQARSESDAGTKVSEAIAAFARTIANTAAGASSGGNVDAGFLGEGAWWTPGFLPPPGLSSPGDSAARPPPPLGLFGQHPHPGSPGIVPPPHGHSSPGHRHWPDHGPPFPPPPGMFPPGPPPPGMGRQSSLRRIGSFGPHSRPGSFGPSSRPGSFGPGNLGPGNFYGPPPPHPQDFFRPGPPPPPPPPGGDLVRSTSQRRSPPPGSDPERTKMLKTEVEAAKLLYKRQKERYRQDREARQQIKQAESAKKIEPNPTTRTMDDSSAQQPVNAAMAGSARGRYPQFDNYMPRRSNTHTGLVHPRDRAIGRITRKLADMGFSESAHPNMTRTIRAHIPESGDVSREAEDNIVTTFIEELEEEHPDDEPSRASTSRKL